MSRPIKHGSTDQQTNLRIVDSGDGTPETSVVAATAGLALYYRRPGAARVAISLSNLAALTDAHADGGLLHIGDGYYRLDVPDLAFASGQPEVLIEGTATGMVVIGALHPLVANVEQDTYDRIGAAGAGRTALGDARIANLDATVSSRLATASYSSPPSAASIRAEIDSNSTQLAALVARVTSTLFTGITSLAEWLGLMAGKQVGNTTARTEIRASGAGSGTYDETTDSLQAIRDRGDSDWGSASSSVVAMKPQCQHT